eukprot:jgi/Orpsp1_1/1186707/evm.model.d7180000052674.1
MSNVTLKKADSVSKHSSLSSSSSSRTTVSIPADATKGDVDNLKEKPKKKKLNIFLKVVLWIIGIILFIILAFTIWTLICNYREDKILNEYDNAHSSKIEIDGHGMNYKISGGNHNTTILLFPGFATFAPVIEFKSLYEDLSEKYRVITIEPFGYGFSDTVDKERTLENVVSELRECAKKLGTEKYYIMGHSIAGMYGVEWANRYTDEVLGFIGLDVSVPKQETIPTFTKEIVDSTYDNVKILKDIGLYRLGSVIRRDDYLFAVNLNYKNYSEEEKEIVRLLAVNRGYNKSIMNEKSHIFEHLQKIHDKKFPENVPVLNFVNVENEDPTWIKLHYDVITNKSHSEVIEKDGGHFLHIAHREFVLNKIKEWI